MTLHTALVGCTRLPSQGRGQGSGGSSLCRDELDGGPRREGGSARCPASFSLSFCRRSPLSPSWAPDSVTLFPSHLPWLRRAQALSCAFQRMETPSSSSSSMVLLAGWNVVTVTGPAVVMLDHEMDLTYKSAEGEERIWLPRSCLTLNLRQPW